MKEKYHSHISANYKWTDFKLDELWRYRDLVILFTRRSFRVSYTQTILGPIWLFLNPFLTSVFHMILFGNIAKLSTDGIPQLLFYFTGNAIWNYFAACLTNNANTFTSNASLFGKVYFPRMVIPVSNVLSSMIRFGIQMLMVFLLLAYYMANGLVKPHFELWIIFPLLLLWLGILGMGIGIIISSVTTKYRDLQVLVGFGAQLWMYATPVVYPMSAVNGPLHRLLLWNPVTMPVEIFRYALLGSGRIEMNSVLLSLVVTGLLLLAGMMVFHKVERTFMDTV